MRALGTTGEEIAQLARPILCNQAVPWLPRRVRGHRRAGRGDLTTNFTHSRPASRRAAAQPLIGVVVALLLLLWGVPAASALEPPRPGELARLASQGKLDEALARAKALGNYKVAPTLVQDALERIQRAQLGLTTPAPPPRWRGMPTTGNVKVLALLISFSDYLPSESASTYQSMIFGNGAAANEPYESLHDYYARSSYGQLNIQGDVLGWCTTNQPRSAVVQTDAGREALIKQALSYYDAQGHDFSQYDNNGDGSIDYLIVVWTGPGGAWNTFWWPYKTLFGDSSYQLDGKRLDTYSWQPDRPTPTGMIHETGHALGLPDYYDYDKSVGPQGGVGGLDMMDDYWGDHNAFSKLLLGWLTPQVRSGGSGAVTLRPSAEYPDALIVMPGASASDPFREFFLVQNRSRVGNDAEIPNDGLLIWHVDARLDALGYVAYDNSYTAHKLLRLMEADGLEDIEKQFRSVADAGDFYVPGSSFGPATSPNSASYAGAVTGVAVSGITWAGDALAFTAGVGPTLDSDDDIPGVAIPASPFSGSVSRDSDLDDVFRIALTAGQTLTASITGPSGGDFDMYLYPPGMMTVNVVGGMVAAANGGSYPRGFTYLPSQSGTYYLDVYADAGAGDYTVTYAGAAPAPTLSLKLSGLTGGAVRLGKSVTAKGTATPNSLAGGTLTLTAQLKKGAKWVNVKTASATIRPTGAYSIKYKPAKNGTCRLRVTLAATDAHAAAATPWLTFKVN
jgi:M6 family metalloprotease-like protein